ncbi:hypothetical protein GS397_26220 (plasmid) [Sphingobium yanoikuyae]|uniref:Uncharacterized protein n=1 Tax=Sphingobium yanoikuyae TaxID=13690 RepID=A0A6P1GRU5_SPHYA|nr:hypothetical protein [Sphingobium yanoikuyae]QHD70612.1 hypothetical protein GS397_26220 [Sphingobium yanoikuyae]
MDDAKTSITREFHDSKWVVRAHVVSADYHWSDEGESWTLYRLKVVKSYKGNLQTRFTFFTERNSGGFYMDGAGGTPDFDRDYLLFLVSGGRSKADRPFAKDAPWVNYNCGQSKVWEEVTAHEAAELVALSQGG